MHLHGDSSPNNNTQGKRILLRQHYLKLIACKSNFVRFGYNWQQIWLTQQIRTSANNLKFLKYFLLILDFFKLES